MKQKKLLIQSVLMFAIMAGLALLPSGCAERLDVSGPYGSGLVIGASALTKATNAEGAITITTNSAVVADGLVLFHADQLVGTSYQAMNSFTQWELDNRATLAQWPAIKECADVVRLNGEKWEQALIDCREAYAAHPSAQTKSALLSAVAVIETALSKAKSFTAVAK